ncbi:unnamed protein product [Dibothriocephalus latus]|uniref:Uncharacterized protein n=1 Tax=Dibothriocephalus latus TaxID=60516 RepID=A0A3P7PLF6_DIBLA|nr:unnamed protein product [Dibothriocephalus latus]
MLLSYFSEVIFEAAESLETCVREFPDRHFISVPIKNLYQQAVGVVCWTWLGEKPLSCEARMRVNMITAFMQAAFWELEHCYGAGVVPGQVCCGETEPRVSDAQPAWNYQFLEHILEETSLNLLRDRLRSFPRKVSICITYPYQSFSAISFNGMNGCAVNARL